MVENISTNHSNSAISIGERSTSPPGNSKKSTGKHRKKNIIFLSCMFHIYIKNIYIYSIDISIYIHIYSMRNEINMHISYLHVYIYIDR